MSAISLGWYRIPRRVVLKPGNSALEAARAIEHNNIGAIVVRDQGRVGLVTDRDLAVRAPRREVDARTTTLTEVMTSPVVTLSPADSQSDATRLTQQRNVDNAAVD